MIDCIAHEFQHYLDHLSFENSDQWNSAYKKTLNTMNLKPINLLQKNLKPCKKATTFIFKII